MPRAYWKFSDAKLHLVNFPNPPFIHPSRRSSGRGGFDRRNGTVGAATHRMMLISERASG